MVPQTSAERYARAKETFFAALDLDVSERAAFARVSCGDDVALCGEVESLLALRDDARDFLELPALETVSVHESLKDKTIGGYRLVRELGAGGMGVVFLAEKDDAEFSRRVALKVVKNGLHSQTLFRRFNLEREILNRLEHPNIARLIDGGTTADGLPYFVMEYVEGVPLIAYARANDMSLPGRLDLFRQVCAAVSFAHKHAVIHRDLKPSNILVTADGTAKLLDFGIAKLLSSDTLPRPDTATTFRAMTPEYASPEQITGGAVTTASDVYSLGVILYELLTGARPYGADSENLNEIIRHVCEVEPTKPSDAATKQEREKGRKGEGRKGRKGEGMMSSKEQSFSPSPHPPLSLSQLKGDLDHIVLKALRKEPERRYSSVEALGEDLRRHLDGLPVSARHGTFAYRAEKFVRRNRVAVAFASLVVLAVLGGIIATLWQARRAEAERARAERRFNEMRALTNSFLFELNDEILKGQTQGRELVVKRALEHLDRLAGEAQDDASLRRELAVAYLKFGAVKGKLGDIEGAIVSYRKAIAILELLYQVEPTNREIRRDLSMAYADLGSILRLKRYASSEALETLQKSLALCEGLVAADPANAEYRRMLADVYKFLGDAHDDPDERIAMHRKALALREELSAADPTNARERAAIASIHKRIGIILRDTAIRSDREDDYRAALQSFDKTLAIYQALLAAEPDNSLHRRNVADATASRIMLLANFGDKAGTMNGYKTALQTFEELAAADPKNAGARLDIAYTHQNMCRSLLKLNDTDGALKSCRRALEDGESLLAIDPTNAELRAYVCMSHSYIAEVWKSAGNFESALRSRWQALEVTEQWSAAEPHNVGVRISVAGVRYEIGKLHAALATDAKNTAARKKEHWQAARDWFDSSLNVWRELQKQNALGEGDVNVMNEVEQAIARCDAALGRRTEAF